MGKTLVAAALALLAGLFVGGIKPRMELQRTRAELEQARAAGQRGAGSAALALGVGSLVAAQRRAQRGDGDGDGRPGTGPRPPRFVPAEPPPAEPARPEPIGPSQALAAAKTAADLRAAQYRAAFLQEANLSPQAQATFDGTVAGMNGELAKIADQLATQLAGRSRLAPRDMADIGAKVLDVYRQADDRWKATLDDGGRAALERTGFDLLTQVDLGAFEQLAQRVSELDVAEPRRSAP